MDHYTQVDQANHMTLQVTSHKEACSTQSFQDDYGVV
jgi:hypothetical protein